MHRCFMFLDLIPPLTGLNIRPVLKFVKEVEK